MRKRLILLVGMLVLTTLLVACFGAYLKFKLLQPVGLLQDKGLIEMPFAVMEDPAAQFALQNMKNQQPAEPETQPPTEPDVVIRRPLKDAPPLPTMEPVILAPIEITEDWFDDVLFIGDSRTVGLRDFARLGNADYFCSVGMTVFDATRQKLEDQNFSVTNLEGLLATKHYGKIYISLGLNGCYQPYELIMQEYESLLATVRRCQPHAVIILQGMITVSRTKAPVNGSFLSKICKRSMPGSVNWLTAIWCAILMPIHILLMKRDIYRPGVRQMAAILILPVIRNGRSGFWIMQKRLTFHSDEESK